VFTDRHSSPATFPTGRLVGQVTDPLHLHPVGQVSGGVAPVELLSPTTPTTSFWPAKSVMTC
jgi:hypothetical protein